MKLLFCFVLTFMSSNLKSNFVANENAKIVFSNFDWYNTSALDDSDFITIFSEILRDEDHHSCNASSSAGTTCSATCQDSQNCSCSSGTTWLGGTYCVCTCSGGGNQQ